MNANIGNQKALLDAKLGLAVQLFGAHWKHGDFLDQIQCEMHANDRRNLEQRLTRVGQQIHATTEHLQEAQILQAGRQIIHHRNRIAIEHYGSLLQQSKQHLFNVQWNTHQPQHHALQFEWNAR